MLLLLLFVPLASSLTNFPIVQTSYGPVRGYEHRTRSGFVGEIYKKIPYATAPTGNMRWKKAEPPQPWNYTHDGTFWGPNCLQVPSIHEDFQAGSSEDCLIANIYTSRECRESNASCPVALYIHGGGEYFGGMTGPPDETIVTNFGRQGIIMVTIHYRLGPFGVLALGDENAVPANLAVHDVLEALRFVRQEIHAFGGDKKQITVMGHSSGGTMVVALVFSPGVNKPGEPPLFARGIAMSATAVYEKEEKQVDISHQLAKKLGCEGTAREVIDCLRTIDGNEIIRVAFELGGDNSFSETYLSGITTAGELMPISNMKELRDQQKDHMEGLVNAPPTKLMIGTLMTEFDTIGPDPRVQPLDVLGVRNYEECYKKYNDDVASGKFVPGAIPITQGFYMTTRLFAQEQARTGAEVYVYQLDYPKHSWHSADLSYLMGKAWPDNDENEDWIGRVYPIYFTNFIKGLPLAPDWSPVDPELMNYYSINKSFVDGVTPKQKYGYHQNLADYYVGLMDFDNKLSVVKEKIFNTPIEVRALGLNSTELYDTSNINLRDVLFYFALACIILYAVHKAYQCCQDQIRSAEERARLVDRGSAA